MTDDARGDDVNEQVITDHMLKIEWNVERGWNHPMILPSGPVGLHPFAHVFHYAVECYEGMKAYVDNNGSVRLFRPEMNMQRFRVSAKRMSLPDFDGEQLLKCIETLVDIDKDWIPKQRGVLYVPATGDFLHYALVGLDAVRGGDDSRVVLSRGAVFQVWIRAD